MSSLSNIKRGVVSITSADVGTSKDVALPSAVKTGSSFLRYSVRDRRRNVFVQQGTIAITDADVGGTKDSAALATAVDTTAAQVVATLREKRTDDYRGATVRLQSATVVRATFNPPAAGDTIDVDFQVIEHKPRRAATLRLLNGTTLRAEWDLQLVAGETIDIEYEVVEFDQLADMLLEIDFMQVRALAELGENHLQDLLVRDEMRNLVQYRLRTFQTKAQALAAEPGIPDGDPLEAGEISRRTVYIAVDERTNDRSGLLGVLDQVMETPGITESEE
jgi:hypothetical protein